MSLHLHVPADGLAKSLCLREALVDTAGRRIEGDAS